MSGHLDDLIEALADWMDEARPRRRLGGALWLPTEEALWLALEGWIAANAERLTAGASLDDSATVRG